MKHAVLSEANVVVNLVMWDGVSLYNPGAGLRLVPVTDHLFIDLGWTWDGMSDPQPPAEVDGE
jgi:hypothetical protein